MVSCLKRSFLPPLLLLTSYYMFLNCFRRYQNPVEGVLEDLAVSWFYNWRPSARDTNIVPPPGIEFVCMLQSGSDVTPENIQIVKNEPAKALLTFNEPDKEDQSPLSVEEALALWPQLESTGKLLGSPVTATKPLQSPWLSEFMFEAQNRNLRVDFLNVHYFNNNPDRWDVDIAVGDMKTFLENTYNKYLKPIWVTEFGLVKFYPEPATCPSPDIQAEFLKAASAMMDSLTYVDRYAYYPLFPYAQSCSNQLYNTDGAATAVGQVYKSA